MARRRGTRAAQSERVVSVGLLVAGLASCALDNRTATVDGDEAMGSEGDGTGDAPASSNGAGGTAADGASVGLVGSAGSAASGTLPGTAAPAAAGAEESAGAMGGAPAESASNEAAANAGGGAGVAGASGGAVGVGVCNEQLLVNGDFDAGEVGWVDTWDVRPVIFERTDPRLVASGVTPQQGNYLAWLGGVPNGEYGQKRVTTLTQMVSIPEGAVSLAMSGQIWVEQTEPGLPTVDWVVLELLNPSATPDYDGWQIAVWSEANASTGWVSFEIVSTLAAELYRGLTLPLVLDSRPDGAGTLSVWVDSLRLEARCAE